MSHARQPNFSKAQKAIAVYQQRGELPKNQAKHIKIIQRRLSRLDAMVGELIHINNRLNDQFSPIASHDPETDTVTLRVGDQTVKMKLNRADPDTPTKLESVTTTGAYTAGGENPELEDEKNLKESLESLLESFYQSAFQIRRLVRALPNLKKFECMEITIVRNKLIEHPEEEDPYTFGFGTMGPTVRPLNSTGREWRDEGLVPNTEAFDEALSKAFS